MKSTRIFAAVLVAALALSCKSNSDVKVDVELPTHAEVDSVSYLLGINFGSFLKGNDLCDNLSELNMSELKKGMNDFLKAEGNVYDPEFGKQFKINPEDMGRIINGYLSKKNEYTAAVNKAKGEKFLEENLKNSSVSATEYTKLIPLTSRPNMTASTSTVRIIKLCSAMPPARPSNVPISVRTTLSRLT